MTKPGKYDPPEKEEMLKKHPEIRVLGEVFMGPINAILTQKAKEEDGASRVRPEETTTNLQNQLKRGRKTVVTQERAAVVCEVISKGGSERAGCLKATIGSTAWNRAKRVQEGLRAKIEAARAAWAKLKYDRHINALYASQAMRSARRKALKPKRTYQAGLVMWYLTSGVPLNYAAIPESEVKAACERFGYTVEQWQRQAAAFGLWQKIYEKRAKMRGDPRHSTRSSSGGAPYNVFNEKFNFVKWMDS